MSESRTKARLGSAELRNSLRRRLSRVNLIAMLALTSLAGGCGANDAPSLNSSTAATTRAASVEEAKTARLAGAAPTVVDCERVRGELARVLDRQIFDHPNARASSFRCAFLDGPSFDSSGLLFHISRYGEEVAQREFKNLSVADLDNGWSRETRDDLSLGAILVRSPSGVIVYVRFEDGALVFTLGNTPRGSTNRSERDRAIAAVIEAVL